MISEDVRFILALLGSIGLLVMIGLIWMAITWPRTYSTTLDNSDERVDGVVVATIKP